MRTRAILVAVAPVVALAACGSGDKTFRQQGLRFSYPGDFKAGKAVGATPPGQVVGIVGLDRDDYVAVRGIRGTALPLDRLKASLPAVVVGVVPSTVRAERHSNLKMVTAVQTTVPGSESRLYFFNGAGHTWQIECRAGQAKRGKLQAACRKAINSISF